MTKEAMIINSPGIYKNLSFDEYLRIDAVSQTFLKKFSRSPAHAKAWRESSDDPTSFMADGELFHCAGLEPLEIANRYVVLNVNPDDPANVTSKGERPKSPPSTTWYKAKVAEFKKANEGKIVVEHEKYGRIVSMAKQMHSNDAVRNLFARNAGREIVILWHDEQTGLLCKARLDAFSDDDWPTIGDLKKAQNADDQWHDGKRPFDWTIEALGYDVQSAFYTDGVKAETGKEANFLMIPVEDVAPFGMRVWDMSDWIRIGRLKYRNFLRQYKRCMESGIWPAYPQEIVTAVVPASVEKQFAMEVEAA